MKNKLLIIGTILFLLASVTFTEADASPPVSGCTIKVNVNGKIGSSSTQVYIAKVLEIVRDRGGQGACPFSKGDLLELDNSERYSQDQIDLEPILLGKTFELTQTLRCGSSVVEPDGTSQGDICSGYYLDGWVLNESGKKIGDVPDGRKTFVSFRYQAHLPHQYSRGGISYPGEVVLPYDNNAEIKDSANCTALKSANDMTLASKGTNVIALQNWLMDSGFPIPAGATGYFGAQTQSALARYQTKMGIIPAVGYFGPTTRASVKCTPAVVVPSQAAPIKSVPQKPTNSPQAKDLISIKELNDLWMGEKITAEYTKNEYKIEGYIKGYQPEALLVGCGSFSSSPCPPTEVASLFIGNKVGLLDFSSQPIMRNQIATNGTYKGEDFLVVDMSKYKGSLFDNYDSDSTFIRVMAEGLPKTGNYISPLTFKYVFTVRLTGNTPNGLYSLPLELIDLERVE